MRDPHPNSLVFYRHKTVIHVELRFAVLEKLAKFEKWCSFEEKFGNDTSGTENIHSFGHSAILPTLNILACACQLRLLGANLWIFTRCVESFWCNVTSSASGGVKVEGEVGRVVEGEISRFIGSEIGDINPVPGGDEDVLAFDISMRDLAVAGITQSCKYLKCDPFLLDGRKEGPSTTLDVH